MGIHDRDYYREATAGWWSDLAGRSGTFWLVANALEKDPTLREAAARASNVRIAEEGYGAGVYEAVVTTLAGG